MVLRYDGNIQIKLQVRQNPFHTHLLSCRRKDFIQPTGERIYPEYDNRTTQHIELQGFGNAKQRTKEEDEEQGNKGTWGENR